MESALVESEIHARTNHFQKNALEKGTTNYFNVKWRTRMGHNIHQMGALINWIIAGLNLIRHLHE